MEELGEKDWDPLWDEADPDDDPSSWVKVVNHPKYGKFVWIEKAENGFDVTVIFMNELKTLVTCKSMTSAKRWVAIHLRSE